MPEPKWVISMGVCASSGGFYRAYHVTQGIDEIVPVDVYVPGLPADARGADLRDHGAPEEDRLAARSRATRRSARVRRGAARRERRRGRRPLAARPRSSASASRPRRVAGARLEFATSTCRRSRSAPRGLARRSRGFLRDDPGCQYDLFLDLCGVDNLRRRGRGRRRRFEAVVHLHSLSRNEHVRVRVVLPDAGRKPSLPSVESVWPAANWFEREAYDLFGFGFPGHPNLQRLLSHDAFVGHALRKDYAPGQRWFFAEEDLRDAGAGRRTPRSRPATSRPRRSRSARRTPRRTGSST